MLMHPVKGAYAALDFSGVVQIGVNEMNLRKGQEYLTVFADLLERRVLFAVEGKDHTSFTAFVEELLRHNGHPHAIRQVAMDLSAAYRKGARETMRNAQLVYDPFHVTALVGSAVDAVRRQEAREGEDAAKASLKGSMYLFRKNPENLTARQAQELDALELKNLATGQAYQVRLELSDIYRRAQTPQKARYRLEAWVHWAEAKCERWGEVTGATGQSGEDDSDPSGRHSGALEGRVEHRVHGRAEQRLQRRKAQGSRLSKHRVLHHHALLCRWKAQLTLISQPQKIAKNHTLAAALTPRPWQGAQELRPLAKRIQMPPDAGLGVVVTHNLNATANGLRAFQARPQLLRLPDHPQEAFRRLCLILRRRHFPLLIQLQQSRKRFLRYPLCSVYSTSQPQKTAKNRPGCEYVVNRLIGWEILGQQAPVAAGLGDVEQRVHNAAKRGTGSAGRRRFGQHRFEKLPLSIGKVGGELCILHRLERPLPRRCGPSRPCPKSTSKCGFQRFS